MFHTKKARSVNPFTGETNSEHDFLTEKEIATEIQKSWDAFLKYRTVDVKTRSARLHKLADYLDANVDRYAQTIAKEMGKPIKESKGEVQKCAKHCRFFADHLEEYTKPEEVKNDADTARNSYILFQPLGVIFHITPFNFPIWLIFKGVIPAIAMGNTVVNKNPQSCPECGILVEEAFKAAGFADGEFKNLIVSQESSEAIISNNSVRGVSFTGSTSGGSNIASLAGKHCKKAVMELGGNDPFIVLKDADIDLAVDRGLKSRIRNAGQVCTAAKRFIIAESIYDEFLGKLVEAVKKIKVGDPMEEDTEIGPLSKKDGLESTELQVKKSEKEGGKVVYGGRRSDDEKLKKGFFYLPTIVEVNEDNSLLKEETFGPVFALIKFKDEKDAVRIANDTEYGLAGAVFSRDVKRAEEIANQVEAGNLFVNEMVSSGSGVPAGGVKASGFGREGGKYGAHEFVNIKGVVIGKGELKK